MADETNQLRVRLVTPERTLFEHPATAVELPAKNGYMEVLYGHAPLVAELGAGDVTLHGGPDGDEKYNVSWGFVEVLPDRVTIIIGDTPQRTLRNVEEMVEAIAKVLPDKGQEARVGVSTGLAAKKVVRRPRGY